ncbi:fibronectin type III domain-containing protein, partial [candidate division WOR-3 bacterium]|nr:fibronectin type III domain-containing protein [candidate division WOR-3 bacterium]
MKITLCRCLAAVFFCYGMLAAHDVGTHWYVGLQTLDVWQNYDSEFYNLVKLTRTDVLAVRARKFYLIGLALPDILDNQDAIYALVDTLYALRGGDPPWPFQGSGFHIEDQTMNEVQTRIELNGQPHNLAKLKEMIDWVRTNVGEPENRAVVYGACMHVIHDLYAHMVLQPGAFGYGKVYHRHSVPPFDEPLFLAEEYYEIFTPTFIPNWNFVATDLYRGFFMNTFQLVSIDAESPCADLAHVYDELGRPVYGFQDGNWASIETFVTAANAVQYGTPSLTRERLEAYIHGSFVGFFILFGYEKGGSNIGGLAGHPNWNFADILDYLKNIGEDNFTAGMLLSLAYDCVIRPMSASSAITFLHKLLTSPLNVKPWAVDLIPYLDLAEDMIEDLPGSWCTYLESPEGIATLWPAITNFYEFGSDYGKLSWTVLTWNQGTVKKPNLRASYSNEIGKAIALKDFYYQSLVNGSSYFDTWMDNRPIYTAMRKQGPLGGLFDVTDVTYYDQPTVLKMHFSRDASPVWEEIEIPNSPYTIGLEYDIFKYGRTRIQVYGKGFDGCPPEHQLYVMQIFGSVGRHSGNLVFDAFNATNNGDREASFRVSSYSYTNWSYDIMIDSDYRGKVPQQAPYTSWFNVGIPTRTAAQDPINDPMRYWPYVLQIVPLRKPINLDCYEIYPRQILLTWTDQSNLEDGFLIARQRDGGQWIEDYKSVGASVTQFIDTMTLFHTYIYKIRAYDIHGRTSAWSDTAMIIPGMIAQTPFSEITAFNANNKSAAGLGDTIHLLANADVYPHCAYYSTSNNGGLDFSSWELITECDTNAALALDPDGTPWI